MRRAKGWPPAPPGIVARDPPPRPKGRRRRAVIEIVAADPSPTEAFLVLVDGVARGAPIDRETVRLAVVCGSDTARGILASAHATGIAVTALRLAPPTLVPARTGDHGCEASSSTGTELPVRRGARGGDARCTARA